MRESYGVGSFLLGLGIGAAAGIAVNRWLEHNHNIQSSTNKNSQFTLDRSQIAQYAEEILQSDSNTTNSA